MVNKQFDKDEAFRIRMRPHAEAIYRERLGATAIEDLRKDGVRVHVLDKEFGIDTLATMSHGQWLSIQEKYRRHDALINKRLRVNRRCPDFTQEYMNGEGTKYEAPGEWFKLGAQLYFFGWAREDESAFAEWVLMDIPRYKLIIETAGGLDAIGRKCANKQHGRASFYGIPIVDLDDAWIAASGNLWRLRDRIKGDMV